MYGYALYKLANCLMKIGNTPSSCFLIFKVFDPYCHYVVKQTIDTFLVFSILSMKINSSQY